MEASIYGIFENGEKNLLYLSEPEDTEHDTNIFSDLAANHMLIHNGKYIIKVIVEYN